MGLPERRKIKELQETTFPGPVKEIEEICGAPIAYDDVQRTDAMFSDNEIRSLLEKNL